METSKTPEKVILQPRPKNTRLRGGRKGLWPGTSIYDGPKMGGVWAGHYKKDSLRISDFILRKLGTEGFRFYSKNIGKPLKNFNLRSD